LIAAKNTLGSILNCVEFVDRTSVNTVIEQLRVRKNFPFQREFPFYCLIETASQGHGYDEKAGKDEDMGKLFEFLGQIEDNIIDGVIAQDMTQLNRLWFLREECANATI
jgi:hypothetical protein